MAVRIIDSNLPAPVSVVSLLDSDECGVVWDPRDMRNRRQNLRGPHDPREQQLTEVDIVE